MAHTNRGLQPSLSIKVHYTMGMATSWALSGGVSMSDVCSAASWTSPDTFGTCCSRGECLDMH